LIKMYFSDHQDELVEHIKLKYEPGTKFQYSSMSTLLLGICLEKATGVKVADYLEEKIWKPMGAEFEATFAKDKDGRAKFWGGLAARPIDLAKFGRIYLQNGCFEDASIIPRDWVMACRDRDTTCGSPMRYNYAFWMDAPKNMDVANTHDFMATGYKGQMVYVNPDKNLIIVRTGEKEKGINWTKSLATFASLPLIRQNQLPEDQDMHEAITGSFKDQAGHYIQLEWDQDVLVCNYDDKRIPLKAKSKNYYTDSAGKGYHILVEFKNKKAKKLVLQFADQISYFSPSDLTAGN